MESSVKLEDLKDIKEVKAHMADMFLKREQHSTGYTEATRNIELLNARLQELLVEQVEEPDGDLKEETQSKTADK